MDPVGFSEKLWAALGEPVRRRILELLSAGEQPAGRVVEFLQEGGRISQPAASQHLRVLRNAGLVTVRAEGRRRLYALDPGGVDAARGWLGHLLDPMAPLAQPLDALATEVSRGKRRGRTTEEAERRTG